MLDKEIRMTAKRHSIGQNVFKGMGDSAPAFGMIGTLIGLVQMLANMSDPASIGPAHGSRIVDHPLWGAHCQPGLSSPGGQTRASKQRGTGV